MLLLWSANALAATVEVKPGDDLVNLTAALTPGTEIVFSTGTYTLTEGLTWTAPGTADQPIVLRAADGASPILETTGGGHVVEIIDSTYLEVRGLTLRGGAGWESGDYEGLEIENSSYILVEDCVIGQVAGTAVELSGDNHNITLQHNELHDTLDGAGIYTACWDASCWTQDSLFANNWIHDIGLNTEDDTAIYIDHGGNNITIQDNVIHDVSWAGIYTKSTEYSPPNIVLSNVVWNTGSYGVRITGAAEVRNNIVFGVLGTSNGGGHGMVIENNDRDTLEGVVVSHNTVADTVGYAYVLSSWAGRTGMVFANNLAINPIGLGLDVDGEGAIDDSTYLSHNVVTGYVALGDEQVLPDGAVLPGNGYADVENAEAWNFYPIGDSAIVDAADPAGDAWVPETDFNGLAREGDTPDVGAYEFSGNGNPGWAVQEGFKTTTTAVIPDKVMGGCCSDKDSSAGLLLFGGWMMWGMRRRRDG